MKQRAEPCQNVSLLPVHGNVNEEIDKIRQNITTSALGDIGRY